MRRVIGTVAVLVGMLALSGCGGGDPLPTLPPSPSSTPVFASEEDALAAATDAYEAYLKLWAQIASDPNSDPTEIAAVSSGDFYSSELEGITALRDNGWTVVGASTLRSVELQYVNLNATAPEQVLGAYVCVDVSAVDVIDATGASVVAESRPDLQAFEVLFDLNDKKALVPSSREPWDPESVCAALL